MDRPFEYDQFDEGAGMSYWAIDPVLQYEVERTYADDSPEAVEWGRARLSAFGETVGTVIAENADVIDRHGPELHTYDRDGNVINEVEYHPSQFENERLAYGAGIVRDSFVAPEDVAGLPSRDEPLPLTHNLAMEYLLSYADPGFTCPVAMTAGVALVLEKFADDSEDPERLWEAYEGLVATDPDDQVEGAMFLTEIGGGSDVGGGTETVAEPAGDGTWELTGEKWFCSNLDAGAKLVLARRPDAPDGTDGLSLFLVPHEIDGRPNGLRCRRLKDKLGTISVPTGEVELDGATGYLVGEPERGFKYMTEMLNLERLSNAFASCGIIGRAVLESTVHAANREVFGKPIAAHPLMRRDLVDLAVDHEAATAYTFEAGRVFAARESARRHGESDEETFRLMRVLVPIAKLRTGRLAVDTASYAMEVLGGNGYVREFVTHRLLRDAQVLPIWEGTTNVLSLDVLRALEREAAHEPLLATIDDRLESLTHDCLLESADVVRAERIHLAESIEGLATGGPEYAQLHAKRFANDVYDVFTAALLLEEAQSRIDDAGDGRKALVATRFVERHLDDAPDATSGERFTLEHFDPIVRFAPVDPDAL